jgi:hypothetical protein
MKKFNINYKYNKNSMKKGFTYLLGSNKTNVNPNKFLKNLQLIAISIEVLQCDSKK